MDAELLERLGDVGSTAHRAVLPGSGRIVVVKRAPATDARACEGLAREAAVLSRVRHRSLVELLGTGRDAEARWNVLAHASGGPVAALPSPGTSRILDVGRGVAGALAELHRAGVLHRDVTPSNVLLDAELVPVLCDLDRALDPHDAPRPADGLVVGTPPHVDPRVLAGAAPDERADLYGLGSTLWTLLTGAPPAPDGPTTPRTAPSDVPDAVVRAILDLLRGGVTTAANAELAFTELLASTAPRRPGPVRTTAGGAPRDAHRWAGPPDPGGGTREFGPRPPLPTPPEPVRRWPALAAAATVALAPVLVLAAPLAPDRPGPGPSPAPVTQTPDAETPDAEQPARPDPPTTPDGGATGGATG